MTVCIRKMRVSGYVTPINLNNLQKEQNSVRGRMYEQYSWFMNYFSLI